MYSIGEFSKIVGITVKALRYYDDIKLLRPAYVNEENGYRYYDNESYEKALWIKSMKKYNFAIKEIQEVLPSITTNDDLADFLLEKQEHITSQILSMKQLHKNIAAEVKILKEVHSMSNIQKAEVVTVADKLVACVRYKGKYEEVGKYIGILYKNVGGKGLSEPFTMYHDDSYTEEGADVEVCIEVKSAINKGEVKTRHLIGGQFASITHIGPYDTLSNSYKALADYMKANNLETKIPSRETYIKGPGMLFKGNPDKYETQIFFPIA